MSKATRKLLDLLALSQKEVAESIGVAHDTVRGWSSGRSSPSPENRAKLVKFVREHLKRLEVAAGEVAAESGQG